jgi:hypothetical protein
MLRVVRGQVVKSERKWVGKEVIAGPEHAPPRVKRYAHKAAAALPHYVANVDDRLDRCAGLAIALFAELGQLPSRADADEFFETLPRAYAEMMELYFFGANTDSASNLSIQESERRAAGC